MRSLCTTVCKWTYLRHEGATGRWHDGFFRQIGLGDIADADFAKIGRTIRPMGEKIGGLPPQAAQELRLAPGTAGPRASTDPPAGGRARLCPPTTRGPPTRAT